MGFQQLVFCGAYAHWPSTGPRRAGRAKRLDRAGMGLLQRLGDELGSAAIALGASAASLLIFFWLRGTQRPHATLYRALAAFVNLSRAADSVHARTAGEIASAGLTEGLTEVRLAISALAESAAAEDL